MRAARLLWAKLLDAFSTRRTRVRSAFATHCQDLGLVADPRQGRLQQRDAHHHRGDGGDAGPHPVASHQCARRGAGAGRPGLLRPELRATPQLFPASKRAAPTASSTPGAARIMSSSPHPRSRGKRPGATSGRSRRSAAWPRRSRPGFPKLRIEEASAKTQARIDAGNQARESGVNKYKPTNEAPIDGP